jgi:hypothetical protein
MRAGYHCIQQSQQRKVSYRKISNLFIYLYVNLSVFLTGEIIVIVAEKGNCY